MLLMNLMNFMCLKLSFSWNKIIPHLKEEIGLRSLLSVVALRCFVICEEKNGEFQVQLSHSKF